MSPQTGETGSWCGGGAFWVVQSPPDWSYMEKLDLTPKNQGRGTDSRAAGGEVGEAFNVSQKEENLGSFRSYS